MSVAAGAGARLTGIEVHGAAGVLARRAADELGVEAAFLTVDLATDPVAPDVLADADVVLVNPPRRGLDEPVRDALAARGAGGGRLIYMSCSPASFSRDAQALIAGGWSLEAIEAWDMLPNTAHVELLACFRA